MLREIREGLGLPDSTGTTTVEEVQASSRISPDDNVLA